MMSSLRQDSKMQPYSSSPDLSSPPSDSISEPPSPNRILMGRANINMGDEIIVDPSGPRFGLMNQAHQQHQSQFAKNGQPSTQAAQQQQVIIGPPYPEGTKLTKDGVPRKKPGRKPGTTVKPKVAPDGTIEPPKQRKPRKPRDPNAPPIVRKRKAAADVEMETEPVRFYSGASEPGRVELTSMRMDIESRPPMGHSSMAPKREPVGSMQSLLNEAPRPSQPRAAYDPVRGSSSTYDPVRETMISRDPYGTGMGSPRGPMQPSNRASASPSIASLVDPPGASMRSPVQNFTNPAQSRYHDNNSMPPSPSNAIRNSHTASKAATTEIRAPPPLTKLADGRSAKAAGLTGQSSFKDVAMTGTAPSKKLAAMQQQERGKGKTGSANSSPRIVSLKEILPPVPDLPGSGDRSILDFGKAKPGEEFVAPTIVLHIPLRGETNKYVNFMKLAEERYGWDALHPRLAANRDRKARIAAATQALNATDLSTEDVDEVSDSGDDASGDANGGRNGAASGPDSAVKPVKKRRTRKEDQYDKDDDFVDDSEMMWEEKAATAQDGFFVYSGPLVPPEEDKPAAGLVTTQKIKKIKISQKSRLAKSLLIQPPPPSLSDPYGLVLSTPPPTQASAGGRKRLRLSNDSDLLSTSTTSMVDSNNPSGSPTTTNTSPTSSPDERPRRGRGRGRGGTARGTGRGRGGGPGSRGGAVTRKPRVTKAEKQQMLEEKLARERMGEMTSSAARGNAAAGASSYHGLPGANPPFPGMVVDG